MATDIRPVRLNPAPVYKLTDERMRTWGGYQWTLGETKHASGNGPLCSNGWLHCYRDPRLALLFNPLHANITNPRLFVARPSGVYRSDALKAGVSALTLVTELPLPEITMRGRVLFAIACTRVVLPFNAVPLWDKWASAYQSRTATKETARAAYAAYAAVVRATDAAVRAAANAAAYAANAAANAAASIRFINIANSVDLTEVY